MKWAQPIRDEVAEHLVRLGLATCPICDGETLVVDGRPVVQVIGGVPWEGQGGADPDANIYFMVRIECSMCGYNLLFNSERFHGPDTPVFEH